MDLMSIGTGRGYSMIGIGVGLGIGEFRTSSLRSPSSISGLSFWLDGADAATLYQSSGGSLASANGDPVGYVVDKSSAANHAAQSDSLKKPRLITGAQAGKNGIEFPDSTDELDITTRIQGIRHIFAVWKRYITSYTNGISLLRDAVGGSDLDGFQQGRLQTSSRVSALQAGAEGGSALGFSAWGVNQANGTCYLTEAYADGTNRYIRQNASTSVSVANTNYIRTSQIGGYHLAGYNFAGILCEMLVFTSSVSVSDQAFIQQYLNNKWGIY